MNLVRRIRGWWRHRHVRSYRQAVLETPGLVGYWPLGEKSGDHASDISGQGHCGTYVAGKTVLTEGTIFDHALSEEEIEALLRVGVAVVDVRSGLIAEPGEER